MKKIVSILLIIVCLGAFVGCNSGTNTTTAAVSTEAVTEKATAEETETKESSTEEITEGTTDTDGDFIDLTQLNSTELADKLDDILVSPEKYVGKTIKMDGIFNVYNKYNDDWERIPDEFYFFCVASRDKSTYQHGMEFILTEDKVYPDDYPEDGDEMVVSGELQIYTENDVDYCHLINAVLED